MIRSSVFYAITFFFFISSVSVFFAYLWLTQYDKQNYTNELNAKYSFIANATLFHLDNNTSEKSLNKQLSGYQMKYIKDTYMKDYILNGSKIIQELQTKTGSISIIRHKKNQYLFIKYKNNSILLRNEGFEPYRYHIIRLIFAGVFFITFITYMLTIRKLKPLRNLKRQIDKFAKGELENITCKINSKDEIAEVANAFNNAVEQIKKLNSSRQLFLRNIMHELKTPITKGLIVAEMITKDKNQQRLIDTFNRLEKLINEFATIEQITSQNTLKLKTYRLVDILDEAIDLTMANKEHINLQSVKEINLHVDFKIFSIALKNMIDNGLKHSSNKHVKIIANENSIDFISLGEPLKHGLEFYLEPFVQGDYKQNKKSFGLGLYIVQNILKNHKLELSYKYQDGFNIFSFEKIKEILRD